MSNILEIHNLVAGYNGTPVLNGVNMGIVGGSVTALIGPSGCGKTTLLRCVNRMMEMTRNAYMRGEIWMEQNDTMQMDSIQLRRKVGMVFQKPNPFPMSIRENVLYGIRAAKIKVKEDELVQSCLTRAAIWEEVKDRLKDNAFGLSVGQQQRVCIARALALSPKIILMDEPSAALDPSSAAKVEASIMAMKGEYTIIIVTHNMQQAGRVSDYTAFFYLGELIEWNETKIMFTNPSDTRTQNYITGRFG